MTMLTGHGKPTRNTKGVKGQRYKDLNTGDFYVCELDNEYSPIHHYPIGGYIWTLRVDGNGDDVVSDGSAVKSVNGMTPDENGNVEVSGGSGGAGFIYLEEASDYTPQNRHYTMVLPSSIPENEMEYYLSMVAPVTKNEMWALLESGKNVFVVARHPVDIGNPEYADSTGTYSLCGVNNGGASFDFIKIGTLRDGSVWFDTISLDIYGDGADAYGRPYPELK